MHFSFKEREEAVPGKAAAGAGYTSGSSLSALRSLGVAAWGLPRAQVGCQDWSTYRSNTSKRNSLNHLQEVSLSLLSPLFDCPQVSFCASSHLDYIFHVFWKQAHGVGGDEAAAADETAHVALDQQLHVALDKQLVIKPAVDANSYVKESKYFGPSKQLLWTTKQVLVYQ